MSESNVAKRRMVFAAKIDRLINDSPKSQVDIARQMGYENQNIITMFKKGTTRVPLDKVVPLASALDQDAGEMLREWFKAYLPEALDDLETHMGMILSGAERGWIVNLRKLFAGKVPIFDMRVGEAIKKVFANI